MVGVLMVAEKPSLARSLAEILSHKRCRKRGSACRACDVYEFEGTFPPGDKRGGSAAHFKMTSVCGHVMTLDFLPKYNKWDQVDPVSRYTVCQMCRCIVHHQSCSLVPNLCMCMFGNETNTQIHTLYGELNKQK